MFRSRQLEHREEAWGGRIEKSSAPFQQLQKSSLWRRRSNRPSTHLPERKSDYLAQTTRLSGELIYLPPLTSHKNTLHHPILLPGLELILGTAWLTAGHRRPWWMLKELTLWPMSQQAKSIASKVLCQVEYWFLVPCTLDTTTNSKLTPICLTLEEIQ